MDKDVRNQIDKMLYNQLSGQRASANDFIENEVDEVFEDDAPAAKSEQRLSLKDAARQRTEQANLYMTIMDTNLFAAGSARPEILDTVENEIKEFASQRLAELLGMTKEEEKVEQKLESQFSEDESNVLKLMASRLLAKMSPQKAESDEPPVPKINPVSTRPEVKPLLNSVKKETKQYIKTERPVQQEQPKPKKATKKQRPAPSIDEAVPNPEFSIKAAPGADAPVKPKRMPSIAEQTEMFGNQAQKQLNSAFNNSSKRDNQ